MTKRCAEPDRVVFSLERGGRWCSCVVRSSRPVSWRALPTRWRNFEDDWRESGAFVVAFVGLVVGQLCGDGRAWVLVTGGWAKKGGDCEVPCFWHRVFSFGVQTSAGARVWWPVEACFVFLWVSARLLCFEEELRDRAVSEVAVSCAWAHRRMVAELIQDMAAQAGLSVCWEGKRCGGVAALLCGT